MRSTVPIPSKIPKSKNGGKISPIRIKAPEDSNTSRLGISEIMAMISIARAMPLLVLPSSGS